MIEYSSGDMFESGADVLVCPVNTVGTMGKGLALAFKKKFPWCVGPYQEACKTGFAIGDVISVQSPATSMRVLHVPTKTHWMYPSEFEYIARGLAAIAYWLLESDAESIAVPALGCGQGGFQWSSIKPEIELRLHNAKQRVIVYLPK